MPHRPSDDFIAVTNEEDSERKHLVQPYGEQPTVELRRGIVACLYCGNPQFRRSRFRFSDLMEVLRLRYPVRCTRCSQRQYTKLYAAMLSYPPKQMKSRPSHPSDTWKNWTDSSAVRQAERPMSTAPGSKARNLNPAFRESGSPPEGMPSALEEGSGT